MVSRKCTEDDIDAIGALCARACADDALLGDLMHPFRAQFPEDFKQYFRGKVLATLHDKDHRHVVTTTIEEGQEVVTGYASWHRRRSGSEDEHTKIPVPDLAQNRAADPTFVDVLERSSGYTKHYWTGARAESWYLELLMVDPSHQRKGFGRQLVRYGLDLAAEENVCASVIASEVGDALYVSCGFRPVGWMQEGEGNPLRDVPGGRILFYEPVEA